ncbi:SDR family NAD(P)-dependent oxidoreductase [Gelidibacter mesophilus]|uniref:SDR family NAD(P)-dependent oxidoreductase n=1 Tax=Gelidibacter mesophilus TaxID=169050 RepID=UPI000427E3B8|nr:SDR family oxidoreductase [Gelidibacter mesophilus]
MKLLENKVCLVSGTNKGIGHAIVEAFAKHGAIVYAHARSVGCIDQWTDSLSEKYQTKVVPVYFDVTDLDVARKRVMAIKTAEKRIDVLINNAGMVTYEMIPMVQMSTFKSMIDVNVVGAFNLLQIVSRIMTRQKSGSIINMASIVADRGASGQVSYATTKGAVIAMTKSAAKELAPLQIRVNAVAPGMVGTVRFKDVFEKNFQEKLNNIGMGRLAEPEEIADMCLFLSSDMSSYVTGQIIGVDGSTEL